VTCEIDLLLYLLVGAESLCAMSSDPPGDVVLVDSDVKASPCPDGDFRSLLEQARVAHDLEVEGLKLESRALQRELHAVRSRLDEHLAARPRQSDELAEQAQDNSPSCREDPSAAFRQEGQVSAGSDFFVAQTVPRRPRASTSSGASSHNSHHSSSTVFQHAASRSSLVLERGKLWTIVTAPAFEVTMVVVILMNGVLLAMEAQYKGFSLAENTNHASARGESAEVWPLALEVFNVLSFVFGAIFLVELVLKIAGLRRDFVVDPWNWLDATVVLLWLCSAVLQMSTDMQFLRMVRAARVARLWRILKVLQNPNSDSLFMVSTALAGSLGTTTWCFGLLLVGHSLLALAMNHFLYEFYFDADPSNSPGHRGQTKMFEYYGSFSRAFLSMVEITFGNFVVPIRVLVENVDEAFILYAVFHKLIVGFAIIGVLNAIFIQETFKAAAMNDNLMVRQAKARQKHHSMEMQQLFRAADTDGSGIVDMDEWMVICRDEWVQIWLQSQDIKVEDARMLFQLLDDGDGKLTAQEIIKGTAGLKGTSAVMKLLATVQRVNERVEDIRAELLFAQQAVAAERM
jgi:hypothetical protein